MTRLAGVAAMDLRQLSGGNLSSHGMQYSSQTSDDMAMRNADPSPSDSVDLSILNPSFGSNVTSDMPTFLDSGSQDTFGNMPPATLIPLSQSQPVPSNGSLAPAPADEWSGTTAVSLTSSAQPQHGVNGTISNQGQNNLGGAVSSAQRNFQAMKQEPYVFDSHPTSNSGGGGQDNLQGKALADHKVANIQGSQVAFDQSNSQVGSQQLRMLLSSQGAGPGQKFQSQQQQVNSVGASITAGEGGPLAHQSLSQAGSVTNGQDFSFQESSFPGAFSSTGQLELDACDLGGDQPDFDVAQLTSHRSGLQDHMVNGQLPGMSEGNRQQQQQLGQHGEHLQHLQRNQLVNQAGSYPRSLGAKPFSFAGQTTSIQSPRIMGMMQTANHQAGQQAAFSGQSNLSNQTHFYTNASSPHPLMQGQGAANPLSYQAAIKRQPTLASQMQAQALSQAHARAQAANQQLAANHQAMYQMGGQQAVYSIGHHSPYHGHQPGSNPVLKLPGGMQQMLANIRPSIQNQLLQGLKARQIFQNSTGALCGGGGTEESIQSPMPVAIASQCLQVLRLYIQEQRKRPPDNSISFWRNLVREFFVPGGKKRWCLTSYNSSPVGRHAQGLFPMEYWFCNLCGIHPGRGFESSTDVLPRLFKIKYDSGLVDELLFLDVAEEYVLSSGKLVLEYSRAVHESIFRELRVVRYGRLRVTFSPSLKILSWEFCTKAHEEVVPRKNLLEQAHQLANLVVKADQEGFDSSVENLKSHCNAFTQTARELAVNLDAPTVNDLGFSKRYVRCLQISEVVNSMKDLISFENKTKLGPIEALAEFPNARKLQMSGLLSGAQGSLSQIINHLTQGPGVNSASAHTSVLSRVPSQSLQHLQGHLLDQLQGSSLTQLRDLSNMKLPQQFSQLQPQVRSQLEARGLNLTQAQSSLHQMQPPALPHLQQLGQAQSLSGCQPSNSQFSAQTISQMQAQPNFSHLQSQGLSQAQSQALSQGQSAAQAQVLSQSQPLNYNQLGPQLYQQALAKQMGPQSSAPAISQSAQSLNQNAGQQSLPGTPQSEMSDMRTTA